MVDRTSGFLVLDQSERGWGFIWITNFSAQGSFVDVRVQMQLACHEREGPSVCTHRCVKESPRRKSAQESSHSRMEGKGPGDLA